MFIAPLKDYIVTNNILLNTINHLRVVAVEIPADNDMATIVNAKYIM